MFNKSSVIGLIVGFVLGGIFMSGESVDISSYESKISDYESQISDYKEEVSDYEVEVSNLQAKVEEASPWFEKTEAERKAEAEKLAQEKEEQERKAKEEKEAQEKQAQAEKEAKEKQGYDTGITYSQLARTPDDYLLQMVKFKGKVVQVMEGDENVQIRLAVGGSYDNILYCEYDSSIVSSRILEDDYITVYGISAGLITYTSTLGSSITIPSVLVQKID